MNNRPLVFVDIHDVCNDLLTRLVEWHNVIYDANLTREEITTWDLNKHVHKKCGHGIYKFFHIPEFFKYLDIREGAFDTLSRMKERYTLVAVTSVNRKVVHAQKYWIDSNLPGIFDHIVIARYKAVFSKTAYAAIEDNPQNLRDMNAMIKLLMDSNHNQKADMHGFTRVYGWDDIARILL